MTTVSDLQNSEQLFFKKGTYNILDCGIRTGKTYWAVYNLKRFTRDGNLNRILFLVDTNTLKNSIINEYEGVCCNADDWWEARHTWGEQKNEIGVMCYQALGMRAMRGELDFLDEIDCICWDECDSIFDFAAQAFAKARKTDFAREDTTNEEILAIIQKYSSKKEYMPLILLGEWERIVNCGRIMCIGLSATPERARLYYQSLVSSVNTGKLQVSYRQAADIYFTDLRAHILQLTPVPGRGYWCFSPWIQENKATVELANSLGFNAIELHSRSNEDEPMTVEQKRVASIVETTGLVPIEYNFVVVNKAFERGFNIRDQRFNQIIVNTLNAEEREQCARMIFPYTRAMRIAVGEVPNTFLDRWLLVEECRELARQMNVREEGQGRAMSWNKLKGFLVQSGYKIEEQRKRIDGKRQQCYYITGEWKPAAKEDANFLALAAAKNGDDTK